MRVSIALALIALVAVVACENRTSLVAAPEGSPAPKGIYDDLTGYHFTLNIIGVSRDKQNEMDATSENGIGSRIFVRLWGGDDAAWLDTQLLTEAISAINKIFLKPGPGFAVLDANATDQRGKDDGALFQMPLDISSTDGTTTYRVVARYLGKPGGAADMTSCGTVWVPLLDASGVPVLDEYGAPVLVEDIECSVNDVVVATRPSGKPITEEVTSQLLFVHDVTLDPDLAGANCSLNTDADGDGDLTDDDQAPVTLDQIAVFDPCLQTAFWNYDNKGLKLMQLRFYPVEPAL